MSGHTALLVSLKKHMDAIEKRHPQFHGAQDAVRLGSGYTPIDEALDGGLICSGIHEIRCSYSKDIGAACGFICALLTRRKITGRRKIVWIVDPAANTEGGSLFCDGLHQIGLNPADILFVKPHRIQDVLWSAGEAARTGTLAAVVLQIKGNHRIFDQAISRQLMLRAHESSTILFVLRQTGQTEASSALTRWHVSPARSNPGHNFQKGIGNMRLSLALERNRNGQVGKWLVTWNPTKRSFENAAQTHEKNYSGKNSPTLTTTHSRLPVYTFENRPHRKKTMG